MAKFLFINKSVSTLRQPKVASEIEAAKERLFFCSAKKIKNIFTIKCNILLV
jgi:hypothetical protein